MPAHPAATAGSKALENQKGLLKAGQGMIRHGSTRRAGGSHTCLLSVLAWWVCEGPASQISGAFTS